MAEHAIVINKKTAEHVTTLSNLAAQANADVLKAITPIALGADIEQITGYRVTAEQDVYQLRVTVPDPEPPKKPARGKNAKA